MKYVKGMPHCRGKPNGFLGKPTQKARDAMGSETAQGASLPGLPPRRLRAPFQGQWRKQQAYYCPGGSGPGHRGGEKGHHHRSAGHCRPPAWRGQQPFPQTGAPLWGLSRKLAAARSRWPPLAPIHASFMALPAARPAIFTCSSTQRAAGWPRCNAQPCPQHAVMGPFRPENPVPGPSWPGLYRDGAALPLAL